jgi:hypothetical protein
MTIAYTNLPINNKSNATVQVFDRYYSKPIELNSTALTAMTGYLEKKGFGSEAAELISIAVLKQAKADGYSPFTVFDTIKGLDGPQLTTFIGQILNWNRLSTSTLGTIQKITSVDDIQRNILP